MHNYIKILAGVPIFARGRCKNCGNINWIEDWNGLETLRVRRAKSRVTLLNKAVNGLTSADCNRCLTPTTARTRRTHSNTFRQIRTHVNYHQHSFYPRTNILWNSLPAHIGEAPSFETMREGLKKFKIPPRFL